jgi:hypothetical protein
MMLGKDTDASHSDLSIVSKIRKLFLAPQQTYSAAEAAKATGVSLDDVFGWMEVGELEGIESAGEIVLPWDELVSFAMDLWEQADVEAALGAELGEALPDLLQLADLEVRIPRIELITLEKLAARDGKSIDAVLARELRDLISAQSAAGERDSWLCCGACLAQSAFICVVCGWAFRRYVSFYDTEGNRVSMPSAD